jgi:hypothetical protein
LREGHMSILGINGTLCGEIQGSIDFVVRGPRLNGTRTERFSVVHGQDYRLRPLVTQPMPLLNVSIASLATDAFSSQILSGQLILKNVSATSMTNMRVCCSQPASIVVGSSAEIGLDTHVSISASRSNSGSGTAGDSGVQSADLPHTLPTATSQPVPDVISLNTAVGDGESPNSLAAGQSVTLPLWIYLDASGSLNLHFIFYYESQSPVAKMPFRLLRHSISLKAKPMVLVSSRLYSVPNKFEEMLLNVSLENLNETKPIQILQVSCAHPHWTLRSLLPPAAPLTGTASNSSNAVVAAGNDVVAAGQCASLHMQLVRLPASADGLSLLSTVSRSATDLHIDVRCQPVGEFFRRYPPHHSDANGIKIFVLWDLVQDPVIAKRSPPVTGQVLLHQPFPPLGASMVEAEVDYALGHQDEFKHNFAANP